MALTDRRDSAAVRQKVGLKFLSCADADELMCPLRGFESAPAQTFVMHGEAHTTDTLCARVQDELDWRVRLPSCLESSSL
jgi:metallo-beta-lactamase family protein